MSTKITLGLSFLAIALLLDSAMLLNLYDLISMDQNIPPSTSSVLKIVVLLWVVRVNLAVSEIVKPLLFLLLILLLQPIIPELIRWVNHLIPGAESGAIIGSISRILAAALTYVLLATGWLIVASHLLLNKKHDQLHGYAPALGTAAMIISVFTLVFFLKTPSLIGHILFDIALIGLLFSLNNDKYFLHEKRRSRLYQIIVVAPALVYTAPVAVAAAHVVASISTGIYEETRMQAATGADATPIEHAFSWKSLLNTKLADYQLQQTHQLFIDHWLFADGSEAAIDNTGLYKRQSNSSEWQLIYRPTAENTPRYIQFDRTGRRGVLAFDDETAQSFDGGETWQILDTFSIHTTLTGKEFGDNLLSDFSNVYLDPETGAGAFVMECRYFQTSDFGQSWSMAEIENSENKVRCLSASPFALDTEQGLALTQTLTTNYLLIREYESDRANWKTLCTTEWSLLTGVDAPVCTEDDVLSDSQQLFYDKARSRSPNQQIDRDADLIDQLASGKLVASTAYNHALRDNGLRQWISGPGYLLIRESDGTFTTEYRIPDIEAIFPVDGTTAAGLASYQLYRTQDNGLTWKKLQESTSGQAVLAQSSKSGAVYFQSDNQLMRWDGENTSTILSIGNQDEFSKLYVSTDETKLLVTTLNNRTYHHTDDSGTTWSQYKMPTPTAIVDDLGDSFHPDSISMDCNLNLASHQCATVFEDGTATTWIANSPIQSNALPTLKMTEYPGGELAMLGPQPSYLYLPADDTSKLWRLSDGKWNMQRLPTSVEYVYSPRYTADRTRVDFMTDTGEVLQIEPDGNLQRFEHQDWDEDQRHCMNSSGSLIIRLNAEGRQAISNDNGNKWLASKASPVRQSACGINSRWVWLIADNLTIHQLP